MITDMKTRILFLGHHLEKWWLIAFLPPDSNDIFRTLLLKIHFLLICVWSINETPGFQSGAWHLDRLRCIQQAFLAPVRTQRPSGNNAMQLRPRLPPQCEVSIQRLIRPPKRNTGGVLVKLALLCGVSTASTRIFGEYQNKPHHQGGFVWASCFEKIIYLPPREEMTRFTLLSKYCLSPHFLDFNKEYNFEHTKKHFKYLVGRSRCDVFLTQSYHFQWVDKMTI